jgi:hypothetical protein
VLGLGIEMVGCLWMKLTAEWIRADVEHCSTNTLLNEQLFMPVGDVFHNKLKVPDPKRNFVYNEGTVCS